MDSFQNLDLQNKLRSTNFILIVIISFLDASLIYILSYINLKFQMNIITEFLQNISQQPLGYLVLCSFYLLGAFPSGYFVAKLYGNTNITKVGSRSSGSTNVTRNINRDAGFITFGLDISKCFLALWLVDLIVEVDHLFWLQIASFLVLLGHSKSIFLKFRGGKGVACSFAIWYYLSLPTGLIVSVVWFLFYPLEKNSKPSEHCYSLAYSNTSLVF